jgi:hypothetical protein
MFYLTALQYTAKHFFHLTMFSSGLVGMNGHTWMPFIPEEYSSPFHIWYLLLMNRLYKNTICPQHTMFTLLCFVLAGLGWMDIHEYLHPRRIQFTLLCFVLVSHDQTIHKYHLSEKNTVHLAMFCTHFSDIHEYYSSQKNTIHLAIFGNTVHPGCTMSTLPYGACVLCINIFLWVCLLHVTDCSKLRWALLKHSRQSPICALIRGSPKWSHDFESESEYVNATDSYPNLGSDNKNVLWWNHLYKFRICA